MNKSTEQSRKKLVFVHVPKTGGTSINLALHKIAPGVAHFESNIGKPSEKIQMKIQDLDWISGHLPIMWFEEFCFKNSPFLPVYYSCVREPLKQVRSHFNWLIEIYFRGKKFYDDTPEDMKAISEEIRASDLTRAQEVCKLLEKNKSLFLNLQSRCVLSQYDLTKPINLDFLNRYEFVATEKTIPDLMLKFGAASSRVKRKNASKYHFDPEIFNSNDVRELLHAENSRDEILYKEVQKRFNVDTDLDDAV